MRSLGAPSIMILALLLVVAFAAPPVMGFYRVPPYWFHVAIVAYFYAILASSWSLLAGYAGQFSFGHMGLMAVGAYTTGLLGRYMSFSVVAGIVSGTLLAGLFWVMFC